MIYFVLYLQVKKRVNRVLEDLAAKDSGYLI